MKFTATFTLILSLLVLPFIKGNAQFDPKKVAKWSESHKVGNAKVGDEITMVFTCTLEKGFHIYAANQPSKAALPLSFELDKGTKGVEIVGKVIDGPGKKTEFDDVFRADISYYDGAATFSQKLKVTAPNPVIEGHLRYQVCDDNMCIPANYDFKMPVKTVAAAQNAPATTTEPNAKTPTPAATTAKADTVAKATTETPSAGDGNLLNGVHWAVKMTPDGSVKPKIGDTITLAFDGVADAGFKILASQPQSNGTTLLPTFALSDTDSKGLELLGEMTIEGDRKTGKDKSGKNEIAYYENKATFIQKLRVTAENPVLKGFVNYIVGQNDKSATGKHELTFDWSNATAAPIDVVSAPESTEGKSLLEIFLTSFLLGLGALLTPCVFPMIPFTVSYFTKQSGTRSKGIMNALVYAFSIILIYTGLGLLLSILFGPTILQVISINPWVNLFFFALITLFGFSFLGLFEISLPTSWSNSIGSKGNTTSIVGIFFMALTLVVVSFSCTVPLVGTAMASAAEGKNFVSPIVGMLGFSTALALPFGLFAFFPQWLSSLPKSGGWLGTFKVTLGFLELALALTYLSNTDLVLHWNFLTRELFLTIWIVLFFGLGMYLLGKIQLSHEEAVEQISVPRMLTALLSMMFAVYMIPGLFGANLKLIEGIIPPMSNSSSPLTQLSGARTNTSATSTELAEICNFPNKKSAHLNGHTPPGMCAFYDLEEGIAYAKSKGKPVFVDFTGHTCKNCRKVEQNIWTDPEVRRLLTEEFVLISLYTDDDIKLNAVEVSPNGEKLYTVGDKWRDYQFRMYNFNAQPYYVPMDTDKQSLGKPFAYMSSVEEYKKNLQNALAEFKKRKGQ